MRNEKMTIWVVVVCVVVVAIVEALFLEGNKVQAALVEVPYSNFGPTSKFESFEGVQLGPNVGLASHGHLLPGIIEPYSFSTGVTLTHPIPNTNLGAALDEKIIVIDGNFGLGIYDDNASVAAPFGDYFLIHGGGLDGPFELTFPEPVIRVGGHWITAGWNPSSDKIYIEAFDSTNNSLGTVFASACYVENWANNFYGFQDENFTPIKKITIDGGPGNADHPGVDGLIYEPTPEPITLLLLGFGAVMLRKRK